MGLDFVTVWFWKSIIRVYSTSTSISGDQTVKSYAHWFLTLFIVRRVDYLYKNETLCTIEFETIHETSRSQPNNIYSQFLPRALTSIFTFSVRNSHYCTVICCSRSHVIHKYVRYNVLYCCTYTSCWLLDKPVGTRQTIAQSLCSVCLQMQSTNCRSN